LYIYLLVLIRIKNKILSLLLDLLPIFINILKNHNKVVLKYLFCYVLCRTLGDKPGEAKSSGNLGNTLKVMGNFDEAMICCKRHLEIARELGDKVSINFIYTLLITFSK